MVKIAIIGTGNWGKNLLRNLVELPDADLRYACDLKPEVRKTMTQRYPGIYVNADYKEVLADPEVEAVVLAVEEPEHFRIAMEALEAGKHTYIEKPMTLETAHSERLVQEAAKRGLKLMVGHLLRHHRAVQYMQEMIAKGAVGDLYYLHLQRVNLGIVRQHDNAWWSLAPHDVSLALALFESMPISISATGHDYLQDDIEDVVFANLKFADGRMAHIHVSWLDPHKIRRVTLVGSQRMVVFDDMEAAEKIRIYDKGADVKRTVLSYVEAITLRTGDIFIPKVPAGEPLKLEVQHFLDCIQQDRQPLTDGEEGLRVVRVLEAGSRSIKAGGAPVEI